MLGALGVSGDTAGLQAGDGLQGQGGMWLPHFSGGKLETSNAGSPIHKPHSRGSAPISQVDRQTWPGLGGRRVDPASQGRK